MMFESEQYRINKLQVFNWGTFSGLHEIPISEKGFLFVGGSGTGKTTLLDAFSALLIPPRWIDFNAAASEADKSRRDRNLVSYIRGAWAEQKDEDSGIIAKRYIRPGSTWSALALTYKNGLGHIVVLVQIFWLKGSASGSADVRRHFFIFEREFNLREMEDFGKSNMDIRKLKQSFPDIFARDDFGSYRERFCRLLGIENDMALKLLHKTQSAKNLGDLNTFLREFMLEKPKTFDAAEILVSEFGELNAAHHAVITARKQIEMLVPARDRHHQMESLKKQQTELKELQTGITNYREIRRIDLLKEQIASLVIEAEGLEGEIIQRQGLLENQKNILTDLENRHRDIGGDKIEQWEKEKQALEIQRTEHLRRREQAAQACKELGWTLSDTPQGFAALVGKAREETDGLENRKNAAREEMSSQAIKKKEAEDEFAKTAKEVRALESQPSNVPATMLDLRHEIASAIGISDSALPFAGELIEVKPEESAWQGAIERVLRGFALSVLVDERNYSALAAYINNTHLGQRIVYYRTGRVDSSRGKTIPADDSLIFKLNIKEGHHKDWLQTELRQRFDYPCVESIQAFRTMDRAITREGQVKHSKTRHEKDDRRNVDDRRNFVLGFDNREKLSLFKQQAQKLKETIDSIDEKIKFLSEQDNTSAKRDRQCQTLINLQWQEIDVVPIISNISTIEKLIKEKREGNKSLQEIAEQISKQKNVIKDEEDVLHKIMAAQKHKLEQQKDAKNKLEELENDKSIVALTPFQKTGLDELYLQKKEQIRLDNLDKITTSVLQDLNIKAEKINRGIAECEKNIESIFTDFKRTWPVDASDLDSSLSSAPDFFAKLNRLETDGLPNHEHRFFDLLKNQSYQNLTSLSTYLNNERKTILDRMTLVNDSLKQVPFNQTENQKTFLRIDVSDRQLPEVIEFKQNIKQTLNYAWNDEDREFAENKFIELRKLVERFSSQDPEHKRWKDSVLDVRQHVEFIGREIDESGVEVEIYRSGAGKSGGQRQKLTTTCLAAALRYQLGGNDHGFPMYAPVILDEAFDKADNAFTELAMNIFNNFGFQMIVATPLKSVMTLEPFIGGACFVYIKDRNKSCVLLIEYDDDQQRLNLPVNARKENDIEIP